MDLAAAIKVHSEWKVKLLFAASAGKLPETDPSADNRCELGQWLHGAGAIRHGALAEFTQLKESHRRFHSSCGDVVRLLKAGKKAEATEVIRTGEFAARSRDVLHHIQQLQKKTK